jgi:hypothetical protein
MNGTDICEFLPLVVRVATKLDKHLWKVLNGWSVLKDSEGIVI